MSINQTSHTIQSKTKAQEELTILFGNGELIRKTIFKDNKK